MNGETFHLHRIFKAFLINSCPYSDDMPHVPNSELSKQEVIETVKNITDLLTIVFPNTKVYPALGNHDYHPKHLMPPKPNDIYYAVGDLWSRWLPQDAVDTFKKGK